MSNTPFSERLTFLMDLQDTNKKQVCESLHIHPSTFSGYLSGKRQPSYDILLRLAAYFQTTCDYLLGNDSPHNSASDLSEDEFTILQTYRRLPQEGQRMLLEEAILVSRYYPTTSKKK